MSKPKNHGKPWSKVDGEKLRLWWGNNFKVKDIACSLERSKSGVIYRLKALDLIDFKDIPAKHKDKFLELLDEETDDMSKSNWTSKVDEIWNTVRGTEEKNNKPKNHGASYSQEDKSLIKNLWTGGDTLHSIASYVGRQPHGVYHLLVKERVLCDSYVRQAKTGGTLHEFNSAINTCAGLISVDNIDKMLSGDNQILEDKKDAPTPKPEFPDLDRLEEITDDDTIFEKIMELCYGDGIVSWLHIEVRDLAQIRKYPNCYDYTLILAGFHKEDNSYQNTIERTYDFDVKLYNQDDTLVFSASVEVRDGNSNGTELISFEKTFDIEDEVGDNTNTEDKRIYPSLLMDQEMLDHLHKSGNGEEPDFFSTKTADYDNPCNEIFLNNKEETNMTTNTTNQRRRVVNVYLIDNDPGLDVDYSLVAKFQGITTEDDNATTIQQVMMDENIGAKLRTHNEERSQLINEDILNRTGNEVKLLPVRLKDLTWEVTAA